MRIVPAVYFVFICLLIIPVQADTLTVNPGGSGDFPTIQDAVDFATNGDVIELGSGRFTGVGNRDIDLNGKSLTIRSAEGNPLSCVISPEGNESHHHRGFLLQSGEGRSTVLEGFTVSGGVSGQGGAVFCNGSSPTIRNCVFLSNAAFGQWSGQGGGGVACTNGASPRIDGCTFQENGGNWGGGVHSWESNPVLDSCVFEQNSASMGSGAWFDYHSTVTMTNCEFIANEATTLCGAAMFVNDTNGGISGTSFIDNSCPVKGGAVSVYTASPTFFACIFQNNSSGKGGAVDCEANSTPMFEGCSFIDNTADNLGGAVSCRIATEAQFISCTFTGNTAFEGAVIAVESDAEVTVERSILSFSQAGGSVYCSDASGIAIACSDVYGNAGGDWIACIANQFGVGGNISADPLFCDQEAGDFGIDETSPCAPDANPVCSLIGAWPVSCSASPVVEVSWGLLKSLYRK